MQIQISGRILIDRDFFGPAIDSLGLPPRFTRMTKSPDILIRCTTCDAWPMAIAPKETRTRPDELTFNCPRCRSMAAYSIGVGGRLVQVGGKA